MRVASATVSGAARCLPECRSVLRLCMPHVHVLGYHAFKNVTCTSRRPQAWDAGIGGENRLRMTANLRAVTMF